MKKSYRSATFTDIDLLLYRVSVVSLILTWVSWFKFGKVVSVNSTFWLNRPKRRFQLPPTTFWLPPTSRSCLPSLLLNPSKKFEQIGSGKPPFHWHSDLPPLYDDPGGILSLVTEVYGNRHSTQRTKNKLLLCSSDPELCRRRILVSRQSEHG